MTGTARGARRDSSFRAEIIAAWQHRCAFCGYSVQLDHSDLGLEAAHIMWCQAGGPETLNNGLACCSLHHQAFDRGGITITDDHKIVISSRIYGNARFQENFVALHRRSLSTPSRKAALPKNAFLAWHRAQVFRGPARD